MAGDAGLGPPGLGLGPPGLGLGPPGLELGPPGDAGLGLEHEIPGQGYGAGIPGLGPEPLSDDGEVW